MMDEWLEAADKGSAVFLDLAKAFNTIDHSILCTQLIYYAFEGHLTGYYVIV